MVREESGDVPELLARWEASGATWDVVGLSDAAVTLALFACTGEEVDRFCVRIPGGRRPDWLEPD